MCNNLTLECQRVNMTMWLSGYCHNITQNSMLRRLFLKPKPCLSMHALITKDYLSKDQLSICHLELSSAPFYLLNKCLFLSYHSGQHWSGWRWQAGQCFPVSPGPFWEWAHRQGGECSLGGSSVLWAQKEEVKVLSWIMKHFLWLHRRGAAPSALVPVRPIIAGSLTHCVQMKPRGKEITCLWSKRIQDVEKYLLPFLHTSKIWISKACPSIWPAAWNRRGLEETSQATMALSASAQPLTSTREEK